MIHYPGTYTDQYQLTMAQVYFLTGRKDDKAIFDYFFRKLPFDGGYAVFAGLENLLDILGDFRFSEKDLDFLAENRMNPDFLDYLRNFRFSGSICSSQEGDLIFPTSPVLQVEAGIIEAQLIETLLLNILNFQTLIATKASRMRLTAGDRKLIDFGLRRAQGPGGYYASRAAFIGGFDATSNVVAGRDFQIPVSGTMAHSFIQSYDREIDAFRDFSEGYPDNCVLLVDTYDTLKSGVPNAITVGKEMEEKGLRLKGIRLDSGDLAWLGKESRKMLDEAGLDHVKIVASNQLDEHVIKSLLGQDAPIDLFGVGTSLVVGRPDAALDGVYKLSQASGKPRIKLSESVSKVTLPHRKQVFRLLDSDGSFFGADAVALHDEEDVKMMYHPFEPRQSLSLDHLDKIPLLTKVMENGLRVQEQEPIREAARNCRNQLNRLPAEYKRFEYPHIYKIGISEKLRNERDRLIQEHENSY